MKNMGILRILGIMTMENELRNDESKVCLSQNTTVMAKTVGHDVNHDPSHESHVQFIQNQDTLRIPQLGKTVVQQKTL